MWIRSSSLHRRLSYLENLLLEIITKENQIMAELDDLKAGIADEDVKLPILSASVQKVAADVKAILAQLAAGTPPASLATQIASVNAHIAAIVAATDILNASDALVNPPPPPSPAA